jgi:hypothetical protein
MRNRYMLYTNVRQLLPGFALVVFCLANAEHSRAQVMTIEGHVRTAQGQPVNDVRIDRLGKTDETGHFKIAADFLRYWKTLMFDKKGFVPQVVPINPSTSKLDVTLERENDTSMTDIPICSAAKVSGSRFVGKYLRVTVPKELKFKTGVDADYIYYHIGLAKHGKTHWLRGGWGNLYGDVYPPGETLLGLDHYSYRRTAAGIDWRGVTKDGKYWRYFGAPSFFETYDYETDSIEAADLFDKILNGVCVQPNNRP